MSTSNERPALPRPQWRRGTLGHWQEQNREMLRRVSELIEQDKKDEVNELVAHWHPEDLVELLTYLPLPQARTLHHWLPLEPASKVLATINPRLREVLMEEAVTERVKELLEVMDTREALALLRALPDDMAAELLPQLSNAEELHRRLEEFGEESAGAIMTRTFVAVPPDWTIGQAIGEVRRHSEAIGQLYAVYIVDQDRRLVGLVKLHNLLLNPSDTCLRDIMNPSPVCVHADMDQEEVSRIAEYHDLVTMPVVDADQRLIGRITGEQLQDVIRDEADEDIKLMSGVSPHAKADESLKRMIRSRLPWLLCGLAGAGLAGMVVGSFEEELARAAVLATFIPIVMAMAGNAGIQSSTVTVRGIAMGTLWIGDLGRRFGKELFSAMINGAAAALVMGLVIVAAAPLTGLENAERLAVSSGLSLLAVIMMASTLGATVPLLLQRAGIDPAMATGVFVTTANDILGVLIFFGIVSAVYFV